MKRTTLYVVATLTLMSILSGCETFVAVQRRPSASVDPSGPSDLANIAVGHNDTVRLPSGTWEGRLRVNANNSRIIGAGKGATILRGDVVIDGNANTIEGVTIIGSVIISGNTNDLTGADVSRADVSARGNNNRY